LKPVRGADARDRVRPVGGGRRSADQDVAAVNELDNKTAGARIPIVLDAVAVRIDVCRAGDRILPESAELEVGLIRAADRGERRRDGRRLNVARPRFLNDFVIRPARQWTDVGERKRPGAVARGRGDDLVRAGVDEIEHKAAHAQFAGVQGAVSVGVVERLAAEHDVLEGPESHASHVVDWS
jgi:hypothetical protein